MSTSFSPWLLRPQKLLAVNQRQRRLLISGTRSFSSKKSLLSLQNLHINLQRIPYCLKNQRSFSSSIATSSYYTKRNDKEIPSPNRLFSSSSFDNRKFKIHHGPATRFGTGIIGNLTRSSIVGTSGDTVVLSTVATKSSNTKDDESLTTSNDSAESFQVALQNAIRSKSTPQLLTVDYRERHHGVGRIPLNNARRRDNSPVGTDSEILASRAIDRALRPLITNNNNDNKSDKDERIHVSCSVQSYPLFDKHSQQGGEGGGHPIALGLNSCAAALYQVGLLSKPVGCVHLCLLKDRKTVLFDPIPQQVEDESILELLYAGTTDGRTTMMEFSSKSNQSSAATNNHNQRSIHLPNNNIKSTDDPGIPEEALIELIRVANNAIQPLLEIQYELKQQRVDSGDGGSSNGTTGIQHQEDSSNASPTMLLTDDDLRVSLGLPPIQAPSSGIDVESQSSDSTIALEIAQQQQDVYDAHSLYQQAYDFCKTRMKESNLRLFGYHPTTAAKQQDDDKFISIHNEFSAGKPLLSKSIRGRREHLVYLEIQRLLEDEFYPSEQALLDDFNTYCRKNPNLMEQMARSIHERLLKEALFVASIQHKTRGDGRCGLHVIRPVVVHACPALPKYVHGSALFSRGETQVLCTTTLGAPKDGMKVNNPYQETNDPRIAYQQETKKNKDPYGNLPVGSLRFTRNQTALVSDLNTRKSRADKELTGDSGTLDEVKRAFLHYDFPSYSTGEVPGGKGSAANRRAIGHGTLAEKAILPILPPANTFPYAVRMTSEVTSSNGSSSMATVCGATLSLCDAGVPIIAPVAGVTVGLVMENDCDDDGDPNSVSASLSTSPYALLLDITGTEDHYGKMDLKVAGTACGVTGLQLDGKIPIPLPILEEALLYSREGRCRILESMANQYNNIRVAGDDVDTSDSMAQQRLQPRPHLKDTAPRVDIVRFDATRKSHLIGPGGTVLRQLEERFGVSLDLSQEGACLLFGADAKMVKKARTAIMDLVADVTVGEVYEGTVIEVKDFGAIIELLRNKEGLLHISEWDDRNTTIRVGQQIDVLCTAVDPVQGSINLSRRQLLERRAPEF